MTRPLADQIIARMLRDRSFLIALRDAATEDDYRAAVDDEFYDGAWDSGLTLAERQYFINLDYQAIIDSQDALNTELQPYSSSQFFITD